MTPITTVISDFGGVLTSPLWDAFKAINERHGLDEGSLAAAMAVVSERRGANMLFELECGRITEPDFVALLGAQLSDDLGRSVDLVQFSEHYFAGLSPNTAMLDELAGLRDAGYRLALLTNNVREWEPRWRAMLPVDELFELVVDSAYVGMRKPDPGIYELTCERLGVTPQECVFVDDFGHNCDAARELGMTAVWFQSSEQAIAELRDVLAERGAPGASASADGVQGGA